MLKFKPIVGWVCLSLLIVVSLAACGQKGALVLPQEGAAQNRATLPQVLKPGSSADSPASAPKR